MPVQHQTMSTLPSPFTAAHRTYVKSLYRRILQNELDWIVQRDLWRARALTIRAEFERNRCVPMTLRVVEGHQHVLHALCECSNIAEMSTILVLSQPYLPRPRPTSLRGNIPTHTGVSDHIDEQRC